MSSQQPDPSTSSPAPTSLESTAGDMEAPNFRLRIDAHALVQLGEQLITDDEQALLELAKNSYDADADYAHIKIHTSYKPTPDDGAPPDAVGLIEIDDNGSGMDQSGLSAGWLMISLSFKRAQKADRQRTTRGRYPLGDKGLGRLGTMKLGKCLSVHTWSSDTAPGWQVTFQWSDIKSGTPLEDVPITWRRIPSRGKKGTTVRIFGLRETHAWKNSRRAERVRRRLAGLLSPFPTLHGFEVTIQIDGVEHPLPRISPRMREGVTVQVNYDWDGKRLKLGAHVKLLWFRKKRREDYNRFIAADQGAEFFTTIQALPGVEKQFGLRRETTGQWYLSADVEIPATYLLKNDEAEPLLDPGRFTGSLDYFDLDADVNLPQDVLKEDEDYRKLVKALAKIYVYRDGFGINMPHDWLQLGHAWTQGLGYYSLKPSNVIGYFDISVEHNSELVEKSDREGFTLTPAWRGFEALARYVIYNFANELLNELGRAGANFLKRKAGVLPDEDDDEVRYSEMLTRLEHVLTSATDFKQRIETQATSRASALRQVEGSARLVFLDRKLSEQLRKKAVELVGSIEATQKDIAQDYAAAAAFATKIAEQKNLAASVRKRIEEFEERLQLLYDMVAVGLSAQAMAHDAPALINNANDQANLLVKLGKSRELTGPAVVAQVEKLQETLASLGHLTAIVQPMLRGKRLTKRRALASQFAREYFGQRGPRLLTRGIKWQVEITRDFTISFNPGRFLQIIDNLTTNSEYWIEHMYGANDTRGAITVEIDEPTLIFSDNGPGVRPDLEDSMFQMFTTGKPKGEGTGLGLFITQQLLQREGCTIRLDEETNASGRRYKFVIDLGGARVGST